MVTSFTKFRLFSHKYFFITKTIFLLLRETLSAGRVKLFAEASELFNAHCCHAKGNILQNIFWPEGIYE
jgi:hypothetical protein